MDRVSIRIVHIGDPRTAIEAIRGAGRRVVTFAGFSAGGYEDPSMVECLLVNLLAEFDPRLIVVCSGATAAGIGAVYALAKARGFETLGIVSAVAEVEGVRFSDAVATIYVIEDDAWGGRRSDGTLSPTSAAMVGAADEIIAIGGGSITRDEIEAARELGKTVRYVPADMNHGAAIKRARANGDCPPTDFKGAVHALFDRP